MEKINDVKQLNIVQILLFHLLPGIPILFIAIICANPVWGIGLPIFLSLMLAILFGLMPFQLGILFFVARYEGKKIQDIIHFREKMSSKKTLLFVLPCILFSLLTFILVARIEHPLWTIFDWVPEWFRIDRFEVGSMNSFTLWLTVILNFILNGFLAPLIEELYFRGFLLPRMSILGKLAPLASAVLFSMYHFFTPWENITRIIALIPYIYAVWYNRNIRIGIFVHCTLNTLSAIGMVFTIISL